MTRQSRAISYAVLYMNCLHESKHYSQRQGQSCNRYLYYRHCHCATRYSMFRKYSIRQAKGKHICEEFKFVHESAIMTLRDL
jgi:hypothetical protein